MKVEMPEEMVEALLKRLYKPEKDREGHAVYIVDVHLAGQVRLALHEANTKDALEAK